MSLISTAGLAAIEKPSPVVISKLNTTTRKSVTGAWLNCSRCAT